MSRKAVINPEWCKSCGYCVQQCPQHALSIGGALNAAGYRHVELDEALCVGCGMCYSICPDYVFAIVEEGR